MGIQPRLPSWEGVENWNWNLTHSIPVCPVQAKLTLPLKKKKNANGTINYVITLLRVFPSLRTSLIMFLQHGF